MLFRTIAVFLFLAAVFFYSWNSDDAFHSYIMARHLVDGEGLVYNVGYRATASTCPLLTLIQAFFFLFSSRADVCGLLVGLVFSGAAACVLFFRLCSSSKVVFLMLGLMVSSRCFMSFTTSGLENPLLFFFGALFFDIYFNNRSLSKCHLFLLALLMSLFALARTDSVLIFVPVAVWAYLARTKVPFSIRGLLGALGLLPFLIWTGFSILYYGFPFPNTYYAKLYTGIPIAGYVERGLWYYPTSWIVDPMLCIVPVFAMACVIKIRDKTKEYIPLVIGLAIYCIYVVVIGGDFMAGRHLTQQFFLSLCIIAFLMRVDVVSQSDNSREVFLRRCTLAMLEFSAIGLIWGAYIAPMVNSDIVTIRDALRTKRSAVDERDFYIRRCKDLPIRMSIFRDSDERTFRDVYHLKRILGAHKMGYRGLCFGDHEERLGGNSFHKVLYGHDIFAASNLKMYLTDIIALQDPLMARVKANLNGNWRVGHVERVVPDGYHETLALGENRICDSALHEYYDKLLLVMKAPLFSSERLRAIFRLNCGSYDRLLEQYEKNRILRRNKIDKEQPEIERTPQNACECSGRAL